MYGLLILLVACLIGAGIVSAWVMRKTALSLWREPALKHPVLIIESDDWGPGPLEQAMQLQRIAEVLAAHRDSSGRKAVMTLGVVLAIPDGARVVADRMARYHRRPLDHVDFAPILTAMKSGAQAGVFALQLHGHEHYWPPALLRAAMADASVAAWLGGESTMTEALPSRLQSRWIDASDLPSKALSAREIAQETKAEIDAFKRIAGHGPVVAVPPTFVWTEAVEQAWAQGGIKVIVTPGRRYTGRGDTGELQSDGRAILNADTGAEPITYVVRDEYFEPSRGHRAERALAALARKSALARPLLLETHRFNFIGDVQAQLALRELGDFLTRALQAFPRVAFMSTEELARRLQQRDPRLVECGLASRIHLWLRRLWTVSRVRKIALLTGIVIPGAMVYAFTQRSTRNGAVGTN